MCGNICGPETITRGRVGSRGVVYQAAAVPAVRPRPSHRRLPAVMPSSPAGFTLQLQQLASSHGMRRVPPRRLIIYDPGLSWRQTGNR